MTLIDEVMAEEAVLKKATEIHKAKVDMLKNQAVENATPMRSKLFGLKTGGIDLVDGKPPETVVSYSLSEPQKVIDWMDETRPETDGFASDNLAAYCQWWFEHTGELAPGFYRNEYQTEGKPMSARFVVRKADDVIAVLREKPELAQETLHSLLGGDDMKLLGDGE